MTSVAVYGSLFGFVCLENILSVSPRLSSALLLFCSSALLLFWTSGRITTFRILNQVPAAAKKELSSNEPFCSAF
jgi:hypothetical protein